MKRYRVTLTSEEREELGRLLARGKADVRKLKHAQVLLKADEAEAEAEAEAGPGWVDERIAEALEVGLATVQRLQRLQRLRRPGSRCKRSEPRWQRRYRTDGCWTPDSRAYPDPFGSP
jgi:cytochrome c-type biogenesis protein CcmH/NrfG